MIIVSPLHAVQWLASKYDVSHVISLLGPDSPHPELQHLAPDVHLKMVFNDICEPIEGLTPPSSEHVGTIIDFINTWDRSGTLLIHCYAGISRSTAAAFIAMCLLNPQENEVDLAGELRQHSPQATPNKLMVTHADDILKRHGRMCAAVAEIGRGEDAYEGSIFSWQVARSSTLRSDDPI